MRRQWFGALMELPWAAMFALTKARGGGGLGDMSRVGGRQCRDLRIRLWLLIDAEAPRLLIIFIPHPG